MTGTTQPLTGRLEGGAKNATPGVRQKKVMRRILQWDGWEQTSNQGGNFDDN